MSIAVQPRKRDARVTAARIADWLALAAAPCFAGMALLSAVAGDGDAICSARGASFHFGSMSIMYLMMSAFHLPRWLRRPGA
jgi:hypothetical protein